MTGHPGVKGGCFYHNAAGFAGNKQIYRFKQGRILYFWYQ